MKELIDGCVAQVVADPDDCTLRVYVYPTDTAVSWEVMEYPTVEIADDGSSFSADEGAAEATYTSSGIFSDDEEVTDEVSISFSGDIAIEGDEIVVEYDSGWW